MNEPGRRSGRGGLSSFLEEVGLPAQWLDVDLEVRIGPQYTLRKSHPTFTNFGVGNISRFLENALEQKNVAEAELRSNPHLAAVNADKEQLRRAVNSGRPFELIVQDGRLTVTAASKNARRNSSASAGEGDNESQRRRSNILPEARFSKRADQTAMQRGRGRTMSTVETSLSDTAIPQLGLRRSNTAGDNQSLSTQVVVNGTRPVDDSRCRIDALLNDFETSPGNETDAMLHSTTSMQDHGSRSIVNTASNAAPKDNLTYVDPAWNKFLRKMQGYENGDNSDQTPNTRSSSFQRHTDEVRQSVRNEKRASQTNRPKTNEPASTEEDDIRPRKLAGSKSFSATSPEARELRSANLATSNGPSHALSEHNLAALQQIINKGPGLTGEATIPPVDLKELLVPVSTLPVANSSGIKLGPILQSSTFAANDRSRQQADSEDRLHARYASSSESSDDDSVVDHFGEYLKKERLSKECGQPVDVVVGDIDKDAKRPLSSVFDCNDVVPEHIPFDIRQARRNRKEVWSLHGLNPDGQSLSTMSTSRYNTQYAADELCVDKLNILGGPDRYGQFPRKWKARAPPKSRHSPPECPARGVRDELPPEVLPLVVPYLSSQEVRRLRLVNRATAEAVLPLMIRSTVLKFGSDLFRPTNGRSWDPKSNEPAPGSLLAKYGDEINKFGIAFEFDPKGMANAEVKTVEERVDAWFGTYCWPKEKYPHFSQLKDLEDLAESDRPLLRNAMNNLIRAGELAISIDTGHGWLNGPDISDLAVLRKDMKGEPKLFGKTFDAPDTWDEFALRQFFLWGQKNTLNAGYKIVSQLREQYRIRKNDRKRMDKFRIREYDAFAVQIQQPDFCITSHVGGGVSPAAAVPAQPVQAQPAVLPTVVTANPLPNPAVAGGPMLPLPQPNNANNAVQPPNLQALGNGWPVPVNIHLPPLPPLPSTRRPNGGRRKYRYDDMTIPPIIPQWPLLFNCYNLAAELGGAKCFIQDEVASPADFPYMPGELTETQVQWLMETVWASRAFLSAYTNSIVSNAVVFKNVHSLHVTKLSSGLISSLAQNDFWAALPNLKNLTLMISPDWRQEHVLGDKFFHRNMAISPVQASVKLARLLRDYVTKLENLSALKIGFVGGGEHQTGLFGRNDHVLPAPVTTASHSWTTDVTTEVASRKMLAFNHVRDLTFENCWFSPRMLEGFMAKSQDTSLHHLKLKSVSLTGVHDVSITEPLSTERNGLQCKHSPDEWLLEEIPRSACWVNVLEKITPGVTILDRRYDAHLINELTDPRVPRSFRGNIKDITLDSCGYVKISGARHDEFCQNGVVEQSKPWCAIDEGLEVRKRSFYVSSLHQAPHPNQSLTEHIRSPQPRSDIPCRLDFPRSETKKCVMMSKKDPQSGSDYFGLGRLTQCVHPVEKQILERAWGMTFGWGDDMERWAAVEDGCYEGGTGRFSGTIRRGDNE